MESEARVASMRLLPARATVEDSLLPWGSQCAGLIAVLSPPGLEGHWEHSVSKEQVDRMCTRSEAPVSLYGVVRPQPA